MKARRAQNTEDYETWLQGGVTPTLNAFDNANETRATVLIIDGTRVGDVRVYEDEVMQTVIQQWGTGGGNVPMIFKDEEEVKTIAFDTQFGSNANTFENISPTLKASQQPPSFIKVDPVAYSIREDAKANNFSATETDTALALQANQPSVQSHHAQLFIAQGQPVAYDEYNDSISDVHHTLRAGTKQSTGVITDDPLLMRDREGCAGGGQRAVDFGQSIYTRDIEFSHSFP